MLHTPITSPAAQDQEKQRQDILRETEQESIERVAKREGNVEEIGWEQHRAIEQLFDVTGEDGASMEASPVLRQRLIQDAQKDAETRKERVGTDMKIADLPGNTVGLQKDADRSIYLDGSLASVRADKAQVEEVKIHEEQHTKQAKSNDTAAIELTGDSEADELLSIEHTAYREDDAMDAAGWKFTSRDYIRDYQEPVNRVRQFLNKNGEAGDSLVREASQDGKMREVRDGIRRAALRKQLMANAIMN